MGATLVLLPGLDGTDVFLRPLVAALTPRPVAIMLAAEEPERVKGVILAATFVRAPRQPILCLSFTRDLVVPRRNVEAILREAPAARRAAVAGGHFSGCSNSDVRAAEVEKFLA